MRFCTKCGASLAEGAGHCRLCRAPVGLAVAGAVASAGAVATASSTDGNPWVTIWLHPRRTIRAILNRDVTYMVLAIAAVGGISQVLGRMADRNAADKISFPVILLMAAVIGPIGGILGLYFGSWLLRVTGRWLGGSASGEEVRCSVAWGSVPAVWGSILWVPAIALTGSGLFKSEMPESIGQIAVLMALALLIVQVATAIWSLITGLHCLGEVQGFSAWRALGNMILAGVIVMVPVIVLIILAIALPFFLR
jgi:hypothetical protein